MLLALFQFCDGPIRWSLVCRGLFPYPPPPNGSRLLCARAGTARLISFARISPRKASTFVASASTSARTCPAAPTRARHGRRGEESRGGDTKKGRLLPALCRSAIPSGSEWPATGSHLSARRELSAALLRAHLLAVAGAALQAPERQGELVRQERLAQALDLQGRPQLRERTSQSTQQRTGHCEDVPKRPGMS